MTLKPEIKLDGRNNAFSSLQRARMSAPMELPTILMQGPNLTAESHEALGAVADHEKKK